MKREVFFERFNQFADAPDSVEKMRELVLDLAVQGKLVDRRASDGNGHALLKKLRMLPPERNSKSRPPKEFSVEPQIPLAIPSHWALTTVENTTRETGFFCDGDWVESKDQDPDGEVRLIQLADVGDGQYRDRSSRFMTKEAARRLNCSFLQSGDILIARMPDPLGRCCRFPGDSKPAVTVVDVCILRANATFFNPDFLVIAINCPRFRQLVSNQATGTTRSRISRSNLGMLPIPLPPLAEQKRIATKVDELMVLCDRLEAQKQERESRHVALARASLARFAEAPTPGNLNLIFHKSYDIAPADLRKSILILAVQGKLVPQDPRDEPAEVFLALIQKHLRRANPGWVSGNNSEEPDAAANPFALPPGWEWSRFSDLGEFGRGKSKHRPRNDQSLFVGGKHRFVQTGDVARANGTIQTYTSLYNDVGLAQSKMWPAGTLCITIAANIADSGILGFDACFPDSVVGFIPEEPLPSVRYFEYFMRTAKERLEQFAPSTAQKNINLGILEQVWIPVAPLAEQRRIVAKVDQLMALVDQLQAQIAASRTTATNLLDALVAEFSAGA
jgi:type I restriction enzyme, S subunit